MIAILYSCNIEKKKIKQELNEYILTFENQKNAFEKIIDNMEKEKLLLSTKTLTLLDTDQFSKKLYSQITQLGIKEIKYGRHMPCDAMTEELREIFFHIDSTIAYWYCPCLNLTEKDYYQNNAELRGYKDLINFNSIGLGGSWAIIKIKNEV